MILSEKTGCENQSSVKENQYGKRDIKSREALFYVLYRKHDGDSFQGFLRRLIKDNLKKVFTIIDNMRILHTKSLKGFLRRHGKKIKLFYLPSYSPDLNPDKYVNQDLKSNLNNEPLGCAKGRLAGNALAHMNKITNEQNIY